MEAESSPSVAIQVCTHNTCEKEKKKERNKRVMDFRVCFWEALQCRSHDRPSHGCELGLYSPPPRISQIPASVMAREILGSLVNDPRPMGEYPAQGVAKVPKSSVEDPHNLALWLKV